MELVKTYIKKQKKRKSLVDRFYEKTSTLKKSKFIINNSKSACLLRF